VATLRDEKRKLLALNLPQSNEVRRELEQYMNRTGLATSDFARRINYSVPSLQNFITGRYEAVSGSDVAIRAAIKDFINSHPIARATEIEGTLYDTANVRAWRSIFYECLDRRRAAVVYGPPGIQKSYPVESLIAELNAQEIVKDGQGKCAYYLYCPMRVRPNALLKLIAEACGSSPTGDNRRIIRNLRFDFGKRRVLIVLDEAQHLSVDCLETVRELLDRLGCGLIFAGSHDLMRTFKRSMELEQWNSRLRHAIELPGMTDNDARKIISGELGELPEKKIAKLIEDATIEDPRRKLTYISARRLFSSLQEIKEDPRFERRRVQ